MKLCEWPGCFQPKVKGRGCRRYCAAHDDENRRRQAQRRNARKGEVMREIREVHTEHIEPDSCVLLAVRLLTGRV